MGDIKIVKGKKRSPTDVEAYGIRHHLVARRRQGMYGLGWAELAEGMDNMSWIKILLREGDQGGESNIYFIMHGAESFTARPMPLTPRLSLTATAENYWPWPSGPLVCPPRWLGLPGG